MKWRDPSTFCHEDMDDDHSLLQIQREKLKAKETAQKNRPRGYKTFFMLNSTELEISIPHKF